MAPRELVGPALGAVILRAAMVSHSVRALLVSEDTVADER